MEDEIDIAREAVGQVMWTYFYKLFQNQVHTP
jgi:hypothetical protein